jgi:hypothetical protein
MCLLIFFSMKTAKLTDKINWEKTCDLCQQHLKVRCISVHICINSFLLEWILSKLCVCEAHNAHSYNDNKLCFKPYIRLTYKIYTVEPRFTNAPVHEQIFRTKNVSDDERCLGLRTHKLATVASWEYRRGSVSCWLTNLVSVYEHFGSWTASRNELSSWTEVPLYKDPVHTSQRMQCDFITRPTH